MSIFVLGGAQTDFARNYAREGLEVSDLVREATLATLAATRVDTVETIHVGNAFGQLYNGQGQLGGMPAQVVPSLWGVPAMRHEAACASGGIAVLAAMAEIEAGRYDVALVLGVEQEKSVPGDEAARILGAASWVGHEGTDAHGDPVEFVWPHQFSLLADEYDRRYGLDSQHLQAISELNYRNARSNPHAQTRGWGTPSDEVVDGWVRRSDCSQITDGAAGVVLAGRQYAEEWARRTGGTPAEIRGWGHRTVGLALNDKLARREEYVLPHVRQTITDAFRRAGVEDVWQLDGIETHDCFTPSEYLAIDHFGITAPGDSWKAVESGILEKDGAIPVNASGGLIGLGHPVGATGVRMVLDAAKQVTGTAGGTQVEGARTYGTLNIGGSTTTTVSFVVGAV
jgi:acetyl-CoA C-acetyltransferase